MRSLKLLFHAKVGIPEVNLVMVVELRRDGVTVGMNSRSLIE